MKSSVVEAIWKLKFLVQKRNQLELEALVAQKGWPRVGQVGREAAMAAYLVVMHSSDGLQRRYLDTIKTICEAGELPWVRYANMFDRSRFNDNLPQRYGTHTRYNEQTKSEELYPLEDESKVNEWRKEVGLPSLQEALKPLNLTFEPKKASRDVAGAEKRAGVVQRGFTGVDHDRRRVIGHDVSDALEFDLTHAPDRSPHRNPELVTTNISVAGIE